MKHTLSLIVITRNAGATLRTTLESVSGLASEIVVVDDYSTDATVEIATQYNAVIFFHHEFDLGKQKAYAMSKASGEWILILDADESLSGGLRDEISKAIAAADPQVSGFILPYRNHFLGRPVLHGGENYRMLRLFRRSRAVIDGALVHEHAMLTNGRAETLTQPILHFSYRSLLQMLVKFSKYSYREAVQKARSGESVSLKKLTMYPAHMFYARFIKDKGYKDGLFRIPLDLGFAYMEFLTYFLMLFLRKKPRSRRLNVA